MRKPILIFLCLSICVFLTSCAQKATVEPDEGNSDVNQEMDGESAEGDKAADDMSALDEPPPSTDTTTTNSMSLYDRVGGKPMVDKIANDFVMSLSTSSDIQKNSKVAAGMQRDIQRHKAMMSDLICYLAGGPCQYTGKPMKEAHTGFEITSDEWTAMGNIFIQVLKSHNVPKPERIELATKLAKYRNVIVGQ